MKWKNKLHLIDYVVCGGGAEHHKLKKEVNFSDTTIVDGKLARVPGSLRKGWSSVNAHGWFSYEIKVKPNSKNVIQVEMGSQSPRLDVKVTIDDQEKIISQDLCGNQRIDFEHIATNNDSVRVRFDRLSAYTPYIFSIKVLG